MKPIKYNPNYLITERGEVINSKTGKILKPNDNGHGYLYIRLGRGGKNYYIHRLVAEAFIPNPDNLPEVDHIDTDKSNNRVENLRWVTREGNVHNPLTIAKNRDNHYTKKVIATNKTGESLEFDSIVQAANYLGIGKTAITNCLKGRSKSSAGFTWKYKN